MVGAMEKTSSFLPDLIGPDKRRLRPAQVSSHGRIILHQPGRPAPPRSGEYVFRAQLRFDSPEGENRLRMYFLRWQYGQMMSPVFRSIPHRSSRAICWRLGRKWGADFIRRASLKNVNQYQIRAIGAPIS